MRAMKTITMKQMSKSYDGDTFAVRDIDVEVQPGEFFVLLGPSGCGKSTLLRLIAGLESITEGQLFIEHEVANELEPKERGVSMVFQNYALYPHLSVKENILFGLKVRHISKEEQQKRCHDVAELLGLTPYLKRKPKELSGGQRQRVALARAIVSQAPICLMDEPLSNLDAKLRRQMRSEIRQIQQKFQLTMVYVTHDQVEAMTMGDRIMVLNEGVKQQVGTPKEVYNDPINQFVAQFIGSPPMNIAKAVIDEETRTLKLGETPLCQVDEKLFHLLDTRTLNVGIRPEKLSLYDFKEQHIPIKATIKHVEWLGNETLLLVSIGAEDDWAVRFPEQVEFNVNDKVMLTLPLHELSYFHPVTGERLSFPVPHDEMEVLRL